MLSSDVLRPYRDVGDILTKINAQIESIHRRTSSAERIIAVLDARTKEGAGFTFEITKIQFDLISKYASEVTTPEISAKLKTEYNAEIDKLREDLLANHETLLEERDQGLQGNKLVDLTPEKRVELQQAFQNRLDIKIQEAKEGFVITKKLEDLKQEYHWKVEAAKTLYERFFEQKTEFAKEYNNNLDVIIKLRTDLNNKLGEIRTGLQAKNLFIASQLGMKDLIEEKLENKKASEISTLINQPDEYGFRMLDYAGYSGQVEVVKVLLDKKGDLKLKSKEGYQSLHWACWGHKGEGEPSQDRLESVVKELLKMGAQINATGGESRTPLHIATFQKRPGIVRLLINNSANPNLKDAHGATPIFNTLFDPTPVPSLTALLSCPKIDLSIRERNATILKVAIEEGLIEIVQHILYHKNWKETQDKNDPNHLMHLMAIKPRAIENRYSIVEVILKRFGELYPIKN